MVDVKNKHCKTENCLTRPNYNYSTQKTGLYCNIHKFENMIDISHKKC